MVELPPRIGTAGEAEFKKTAVVWQEGDYAIAMIDNRKVGEALASDCASILNACIAELKGGGTVFIARGRYGLSTPVTLDDNICLRGEGVGATELYFTASLGEGIRYSDTSRVCTRPRIESMRIDGGGKVTDVIALRYVNKSRIADVEVYGAVGTCVSITTMPPLSEHTVNEIINSRFHDSQGHGVYVAMPDVLLHGIEAYECGNTCIYLSESQIKLTNTHAWNAYGASCLYIASGDRISVGTSVFETSKGASADGVLIETGVRRVSLLGCIVRGNNRHGVNLNGAADIAIVGCQIYANNQHGVLINAGDANLVSGSVLYDNNASGASGVADVLLTGGATYCSITGNVLMAVNNKPDYGVREASASDDYNVVSGNTAWGHNVASYSQQGANSIFANNI